MKGDIYLGTPGNEIKLSPYGRTLTIRQTEAARQTRTVDGTLKKDIMYVKHKFSLRYSTITGTDLEQLLDIYTLPQPLRLLIENDTLSSYTVYMKPINRTRSLLLDDGLWKGVSVELEEV